MPDEGIAEQLAQILGPDLPVALCAYDGSRAGPTDAAATIVVRTPDAFRRILTAPGELGMGRAYVAGDLDVEGDLYRFLELIATSAVRLEPGQLLGLARLAGLKGMRPLPPPPEEARLRGRRHSRARDAAAVRHHYDVGNEFYRLVLGPSLTYSCGVWESPGIGLAAAQDAKHELVCQKLRLNDGQRLLDVGCGWGSLLLHAARRHGVSGVGVTLAAAQAELAARRVADAGLAGHLQVRLQDYRDVGDGPYDAISSIGMFEHVGLSRLEGYFERLCWLLRPGGRLLNHGISRPPGAPPRLSRRGFFDRYVFPDGELHEVGSVVSAMQQAGFEVRHVESLREHYALTLQAWVANLEGSWDEAVRLVGKPRARIWRLFMAASALNFETGRAQVHQILAVKAHGGRSGFPLRPAY